MGNAGSIQESHLVFVQQLEDRHFGEVAIFRSDDGRFVMKLQRTHIKDDKRHRDFQKMIEWVLGGGHCSVIPIMNITAKLQKSLCLQYEVAQIYTQYYNYTLRDLMESKKGLEQGQLWCVLESLLELVTTLKQHDFGINLKIDQVFITLKGLPCVYPYHLISFEESLNCSEQGMGQLVAKIILQLANGSLLPTYTHRQEEGKQLLVPLARLCSRHRLLGKMVKQLLNRQQSQQHLLHQIGQLAESKRISKANQIKLNRFKYMIPDLPRPQNNQSQLPTTDILPPPPQAEPKSESTTKRSHTKNVSHEKIKSIKSTVLAEKTNPSNVKMPPVPKPYSRGDFSAMLAQIDRKKKENSVQMQRLQMRKDELVSHSEKDNKQNPSDRLGGMRWSGKKKAGESRARRSTEWPGRR